jgi:hypothetical protein
MNCGYPTGSMWRMIRTFGEIQGYINFDGRCISNKCWITQISLLTVESPPSLAHRTTLRTKYRRRYALVLYLPQQPTLLSPKLTFPFSKTSTTLEMMMMVVSEGLPSPSAATSNHKISRHYCGQVGCCCILRIELWSLFCVVSSTSPSSLIALLLIFPFSFD